MRGAGFVELSRPRSVLLDVAVPQPRRYYLTMVDSLLRCSLPAAGRFALVRTAIARTGLVRPSLAALITLASPRPHPELDELRDGLLANWSALTRSSDRLPEEPPDLGLLAIRRSRRRLVFAFGDAPDPLLVCKIADDDDPGLDGEAAVLRNLTRLGIAPRHLGHVGPARVQEALPGQPLVLRPLSRRVAATAAWDLPLADTAAALVALARDTSGGASLPLELSLPALELLSSPTAARVRGSLDRLRQGSPSVICHGDVSAQNLMVDDGRMTGLVDWELARRGLPGADALNLAQSVFEQRLGLVRWDPDEILAAFSAAWDSAPIYTEGRAAARAAAEAAGMEGDLAACLEIAYFARRLQRRVDRPAHYVIGPRMAAEMVERVCAS